MKITLTELHVGTCSTVTTIAFDEKDLAGDFLDSLEQSRPQDATKFQTAFSTICDVKNYSNDTKFKNLGDGIYEVKIWGKRLYCFKDTSGDFEEATGCSNHMIMACCGGSKNAKKEQNRDINKALGLKKKYFKAKGEDDTEFKYIKTDDEN